MYLDHFQTLPDAILLISQRGRIVADTVATAAALPVTPQYAAAVDEIAEEER